MPSFAPLEIYLFRGGFARFTNSRYSNNPSDIANSFIHLTNVAIQKTSEHYNKKVRLQYHESLSESNSVFDIVIIAPENHSMAASGTCAT